MPFPPAPQERAPIEGTPLSDAEIAAALAGGATSDPNEFAAPPSAPQDLVIRLDGAGNPAPAVTPVTFGQSDIDRLRAEFEKDKQIAVQQAQIEALRQQTQFGQAAPATVPVTPVADPYTQAIAEATQQGIFEDPAWVARRALSLQSERDKADRDALLAALRAEIAPVVNRAKADRVLDAVVPGASAAVRAELADVAHFFDPATMNDVQRKALELMAAGAEVKAQQSAPQRGAPSSQYTNVRVSASDLDEINSYAAQFGMKPMTAAEYAAANREGR